jgi:predicted ATPase
MFTELRLENFLSFKGPMDVPLDKLTVVLGPNNSGKSNLLRAIRFLGAIAYEPFSQAAGRIGFSRENMVFRNGQANTFGVGLDAEHAAGAWRRLISKYDLAVRFVPGGAPIVEREEVRVSGIKDTPAEKKEEGAIVSGSEAPRSEGITMHRPPNQRENTIFHSIGASELIPFLREHLRSVTYFHFSPSSLRAPAQVMPEPRLSEDGSGLPAVLDHLKDQHPDSYERLVDQFKRCVPEVERILLRVTQNGQKAIMLKERRHKEPFSADEISDGLLLFLAILCAMHTPPAASLICLEEPERGVHPRRLKEIVGLLQSLAAGDDQRPGTQIVVTTHSPYFLDLFKDDLSAVLVLDRDENGTSIRRADDVLGKIGGLRGSPLGEVWYSGVLGGVPE